MMKHWDKKKNKGCTAPSHIIYIFHTCFICTEQDLLVKSSGSGATKREDAERRSPCPQNTPNKLWKSWAKCISYCHTLLLKLTQGLVWRIVNHSQNKQTAKNICMTLLIFKALSDWQLHPKLSAANAPWNQWGENKVTLKLFIVCSHSVLL